MNAKRMLAICTIAIMLTFASGVRSHEASANDILLDSDVYGDYSTYEPDADRDRDNIASNEEEQATDGSGFLSLLGAESEDEVWDALYGGRTLSSIAAGNGKDVNAVIERQAAELTEQLRQRLLSGSITPEQYQAQKAEVYSLVASSAYGLNTTA